MAAIARLVQAGDIVREIVFLLDDELVALDAPKKLRRPSRVSLRRSRLADDWIVTRDDDLPRRHDRRYRAAGSCPAGLSTLADCAGRLSPGHATANHRGSPDRARLGWLVRSRRRSGGAPDGVHAAAGRERVESVRTAGRAKSTRLSRAFDRV